MTDRERLIELAHAVMAGYSIWGPNLDRVSRQLCMRSVALAESVWRESILPQTGKARHRMIYVVYGKRDAEGYTVPYDVFFTPEEASDHCKNTVGSDWAELKMGVSSDVKELARAIDAWPSPREMEQEMKDAQLTPEAKERMELEDFREVAEELDQESQEWANEGGQ